MLGGSLGDRVVALHAVDVDYASRKWMVDVTGAVVAHAHVLVLGRFGWAGLSHGQHLQSPTP